jgi:hypothetical protein
MFGPPKSGKSIICNSWIGQLHRDNPSALALTFNPELRGEVQSNEAQLKTWGIDPERYRVFDRNSPEGVFDFIEKDVNEACQEGEQIKLIVIDSLTGIMGRRAQNADSVLVQQIGDSAMTIQVGLSRILPVVRRHKIALVMTTHVRAEMDQAEQMRGNHVRMASSWATKHSAEYFVFVSPNRSKDGRATLSGEAFEDENTKDFMDKAQKIGHKIRVTCKESSFGITGRTGEFTLDYRVGITNVYEEVFVLARNLGIITRPNNVTYVYKENNWRGLAAALTAIRDDARLSEELLKEIYAKDSGVGPGA